MLERLQKHLKNEYGIVFHNPKLLAEAFTHASYVNEHPRQNLKYYERIEFLGDAVMQLSVSEYLYKRYPKLNEGKLSRLRAAMVCEDSFSKFAKECNFDKYILLGHGEELAGARNRPSLLCDIFEAFMGALFLDQGRQAVVKFISRIIFPKLDMGWFDHLLDHKTELQEYLQQNGAVKITYSEVADFGPQENRQYEMALNVNDKQIATGIGHTKKAAEQRAAAAGMKYFLGKENK